MMSQLNKRINLSRVHLVIFSYWSKSVALITKSKDRGFEFRITFHFPSDFSAVAFTIVCNWHKLMVTGPLKAPPTEWIIIQMTFYYV